MDPATEEKRQIQESQPPDLFRREKTLFLVSAVWWKAWSAYVCYDDQDSPAPRPGPIDNSSLLTQPWTSLGWLSSALRSDMREHLDFEYLTHISWRKLWHWYQGAPAVEVFVVNGEPDLSPVPMRVWAIETQGDYEKPRETVVVSKQVTVGQVHKYLCDRLSLTYYKYTFHLDSHSDPDKQTLLCDLSTSTPMHAYILLKSLPPPPQPVTHLSPSSHSDTQDDSDHDMDMLRPIQRSDHKEVAARIAAVQRTVRLTVQDIAVTEKGLKTLWRLSEKGDAR